jgi:hypothetical protein
MRAPFKVSLDKNGKLVFQSGALLVMIVTSIFLYHVALVGAMTSIYLLLGVMSATMLLVLSIG